MSEALRAIMRAKIRFNDGGNALDILNELLEFADGYESNYAGELAEDLRSLANADGTNYRTRNLLHEAAGVMQKLSFIVGVYETLGADDELFRSELEHFMSHLEFRQPEVRND